MIDGKSAASVTVNGTKGKNMIAYRDVSIASKKIKLSAMYPDKLIKVTKIEIKY